MLQTNGTAPSAKANGVKHPNLQRISSLEPDGPDANTDMCSRATRRYAAQLKTDPQLAGAALDYEAKDHLRRCFERGDTTNQLVRASAARTRRARSWAAPSGTRPSSATSPTRSSGSAYRRSPQARLLPRPPLALDLRHVTTPGRSALLVRIYQPERGVSAMQLHVVKAACSRTLLG